MTRRLAVLVVILLASGCGKPGAGGGIVQVVDLDAAEDVVRFTGLAAGELVDGDRAAEARGWLDSKNTTNVLWKTSRAQTLKFVNDLYKAGAVKVYAIYSPKDQNIPVNMCAELFLELPKDASLRKRVFETFNRIDKELWGGDHTPEKDEGQKYLGLSMDP